MKKYLLLALTLFLCACDFNNDGSLNVSSSGFISSNTSNDSSEYEDITSSSSTIEESVFPTDIILNNEVIDMYVEETKKINVSFVPENTTEKELTYESNNNTVASVSNSGLITANDVGSAIITIKTINNITKTIQVNVSIASLPDLIEKDFVKDTAPYYGNEYFYVDNLSPQVTNITDGVTLTKYNYYSVDGSAARKVYLLVADMNYVTVEVGTRNNSLFPTANQVLLTQGEKYESTTNKKVYAGVNGDYFGFLGGGKPNGFVVKNGFVVSAKSCSYESLVNGMFALSVSYNNVASVEKSALNSSTYYRIDNAMELYDYAANKKGSFNIDAIDGNIMYDGYQGNSRNIVNELITETVNVTNKNVLIVEKTKSYNNLATNFPFDGKIVQKLQSHSGTINLSSNQVAILASTTFFNLAKINHQVRIGVTRSDSNAFSNTKTVIGGRHLLIQDYKIAPNLANESTNGAQYRRARTAVGVDGDGKVMIFICEDGSSSGLKLLEVADFMRYFGCKDAFNLDGGGSTGLITRSNNELVLTAGKNSRAVANTLLITEK